MPNNSSKRSTMKIFTVPNALTALRFLMIYPIMYHLAAVQRIPAAVWMLASAATDLLDGMAARKLRQQSDLGRILDPLADKLSVTAVAVYMTLSADYHFPLWAVSILVLRELLVLAGGLLIMRGQKTVMESSRAGKNSAFAVAAAVLLYVLQLQPFGLIVLTGAVLLTVWSTWVYYRAFREQGRFSSAGG